MKSEMKGGPNLYQAKSDVISFSEVGRVSKNVAQNGLKHILVLDFLKYREIFEIGKKFPNGHKQGNTTETTRTNQTIE